MCCVLFAHLTSNITTGALVKLPMKKWNKATGILNNHQKKEYDITASLRADDFLQTAERLETSITSIIDNEAVDILRKTENFTKNKASGLANAISSFSSKQFTPVISGHPSHPSHASHPSDLSYP